MKSSERFKALVEGLTEDEAWDVLCLLRSRFGWFAEVFDYEDAQAWWNEEEHGPLSKEIWTELPGRRSATPSTSWLSAVPRG